MSPPETIAAGLVVLSLLYCTFTSPRTGRPSWPLRRQWWVECEEHRGGPYTRRWARVLQDRWDHPQDGITWIQASGELQRSTCAPHRLRFRLGRERRLEPPGGPR